MARQRLNVPAKRFGRMVTDPLRQQELLDEFKAKVEYIARSYQFWKTFGMATNDLNDARSKLRLAIQATGAKQDDRLHPLLELSIGIRAKEIADGRSQTPGETKVAAEDIAAAVDEEVAKAPRRGRPRDFNLELHIEMLMALIHDICGEWPAMSRHRGTVYESQPTNAAGHMLVNFVRQIEPDVTTTKLANMAITISRKRAGKPVSFRGFNPFWGATLDPVTGEFRRGDVACGKFEPTPALYCRIPAG